MNMCVQQASTEVAEVGHGPDQQICIDTWSLRFLHGVGPSIKKIQGRPMELKATCMGTGCSSTKSVLGPGVLEALEQRVNT